MATATTVSAQRQLARGLMEARQSLVEIRIQLTGRPPGAPRLVATERRDTVDGDRQRLHEEYARGRAPSVRDELLISYEGLARSLALRFRHRGDADDLIQVARIGLFHAIDRFDPTRERPFVLFARATIIGELKRHLRDTSWVMRVPRSLQENYLNVTAAVEELTAERCESPPMIAVAQRCGLPLERVIEAAELHVTKRPLSIDLPGRTDDRPVAEIMQDELGFGRVDNGELVASLLRRLSPRDRRMIELRFVEEMTQAEIADALGVSQMGVSRMLARTLGRMRSWARSSVA
ncbi:MAG TPA: sigma-70 family RNA polymerase sigma factor [Acidimicrobiia bacterium]|nr:sigma-70 family RNA polymerase sigma factor [Acidimicrobiia bacterium]